MRWLVVVVGLWGAIGCNNVDHPPVIEPCDPDTMKCGGSADSGGGSIGSGSGSGGGEIIEFGDDTFYRGTHYSGMGLVSHGSGLYGRTRVEYDGDSFPLENVEAVDPNWFIADPEEYEDVLMETIQPIDTDPVPGGVVLGVTPYEVLDGIYETIGRKRSGSAAQIVLRIVDAGGSGMAGVVADGPGTGIYHIGSTWTDEDTASTDETGLVLLPRGATGLAYTTIALTGSIEESVKVMVYPGASTVADVPFYE